MPREKSDRKSDRKSGGGGRSDRREDKKYFRKTRRKVCGFCVDKVIMIDYKDVGKIRKFVNEKGKILSRRITGNCAKHQRMITSAVKRARVIALLPCS